MAKKLTDAQMAELQQAGYEVEDIGKVWGAEFNGTYRWWLGDEFQDAEESFSVEDAWLSAWAHFTLVR